jgi:GNAT acetyltransferase-like protein
VESTGNLVIRGLQEGDQLQWDEFVEHHEHGSPFHLMAWKRAVEESFKNFKPMYMLVADGDHIRAVLPLFLVKNMIVGKALLSSPFAVYGGILAETSVELRNAYPEQCAGTPNVLRYITFTRPAHDDEQQIMDSLPKSTRHAARRALGQPLTMRYGVRDPRTMYQVHSRNMRRLGVPDVPRRYLANLLAHFGEKVDIREVWLNKTPVAVSLNLYFRGQMHTYYAAGDNRHKALAPNTFMYFDHLRWAGQNGYDTFDFGRSSKEGGTFDFKKRWNTVIRELPYEIVPVRRANPPVSSSANPRIALAEKIWRHIPLPATRLLSRWVFPMLP